MPEGTLKAVIFDVGNVLVNLDFEHWHQAFKENNLVLPREVHIQSLITDYGTGKITTEDFFFKIRESSGVHDLSFENFKRIWNSLVTHVYSDAIFIIPSLKTHGIKAFALSDTNKMHVDHINELYLKMNPQDQFTHLFDKCYFSHETGTKKTSDEAFAKILKEQNLKPEECLFIDDTKENTERARKLGFHVLHYTPKNTPLDIIKKIWSLKRLKKNNTDSDKSKINKKEGENSLQFFPLIPTLGLGTSHILSKWMKPSPSRWNPTNSASPQKENAYKRRVHYFQKENPMSFKPCTFLFKPTPPLCNYPLRGVKIMQRLLKFR